MIQICKFFKQLEYELKEKLATLEGIDPKKQEKFIMVRNTRNFDILYIKYGMKIHAYNRALVHYELSTEPECMEFEQSLQMKIQKRFNMQREAATLTEKDNSYVAELLATKGQITLDARGLL